MPAPVAGPRSILGTIGDALFRAAATAPTPQQKVIGVALGGLAHMFDGLNPPGPGTIGSSILSGPVTYTAPPAPIPPPKPVEKDMGWIKREDPPKRLPG